ncbi:T9SS type A sorting domain-containing protein [Hymenobacter sp. DH14]|uniref:T9SS type A sorting domain-containing protein n=1 Tax=Hymenobacter cyanobacteriorum TaxID=2926463 RepID=A0A9X1VIV1_9BACT|nr:T9SS type A sorting domain-containing protein [Hymenobacter cyanobacteriorum]MCI1189979.1 T9SS type A sorting domain-containing protein [Hymenobacter cyanobacteriorum]
MQRRFTSFSASVRTLLSAAVLLLANGSLSQAWAQCTTCSYTVDNPNKSDIFNMIGGETIIIASNVNFDGTINVLGDNVTVINLGGFTRSGQIRVTGNNTVIRNESEISNGNGGNGSGSRIAVASGTTGTVLYNRGTISSDNVVLSGPTVINNGNSASSKALWSGYVGGNFTAPVTINNYGNWSGQINNLPNSTINNFAAGTWSAYITPTGTTVINNSGTWNASDLNFSGSLTLNHSGGTWTANLNPGGALTINNSGTWTKGFNFPSTGPNSFVNTGTATFGSYLGMGSATTITNSGAMTMTQGMGDISANSSLTNNRGATFRVTGQLINYGTVSNAGIVASTGNFSNQAGASMTGPAAPLRGSFTTNGYSVNAGSFGMVGRLDFCDSGNATGFDSQTGSVGAANTTYCSLRPLPVELAVFTADVVKGQVQLRWATASEQNSAVFVIERSAQGETYQAVREVAAQGNSTAATVYAATDVQPLAGTSYYRLRQVDRDGAVAYSPVLKVSVAPGTLPVLAYPNPVTDRLTLDLTAAAAEPCAVRVLGLAGQVVRTETLTGGCVQELTLAGLPAGLYLLQVRTAGGSSVQRIEKR